MSMFAFLAKSEPPVTVQYSNWLDFNYWERSQQYRFSKEMEGVRARMHITEGLLENPMALQLPESLIEHYYGNAVVVGQTPQGGLVWIHDLGSMCLPGDPSLFHFIGIYDPKNPERCKSNTTLEWLLNQGLLPPKLYDKLIEIYAKVRDLPILVFDEKEK